MHQVSANSQGPVRHHHTQSQIMLYTKLDAKRDQHVTVIGHKQNPEQDGQADEVSAIPSPFLTCLLSSLFSVPVHFLTVHFP